MTTYKDIYTALTSAGASTIEAEGILANVINESAGNPEAVGDQGTSFGIVQEHGAYSYLVTGNEGADLSAQTQLLKNQNAFQFASGSTVAEAAGNFAAQFEKCVGCQAGGAQYQQRVANAAQVQGWAASGNWPTVGATGGQGSGISTTSVLSGPFPGGGIDPLNWPSDIFGGISSSIAQSTISALEGAGKKIGEDIWSYARGWLIRIGLILFGAFIIYAGINGLLRSGQGPAQMTGSAVRQGAKSVMT